MKKYFNGSCYLGGWMQSLIALLTLLSVGNDTISMGGFIGAMIAVCVLVISIKLMTANATKHDDPTDWESVKSFALGSSLSLLVIIGIFLLSR